VYYNHKPVKMHDKVDGVSAITSDDKTAELSLFSAQKGKFRLSFVNSKPVSANLAVKGSELYQIIVANYIQPYTTEKTLTTRGDFDLKTCFNPSGGDNKALIIEGELLAIKSQNLKAGAADKFFICTIKGKDTISNLIHRNNSFLIFDKSAFKGITNLESPNPEPEVCFIKHGYMFNGKYMEEPFSGPVKITFLTKENLQSMVSTFEEGLPAYYQNDRKKMMADIESQLNYYYGSYFEPAVRQVLIGSTI
jgi:hypothetical protein